MLSFPEFERLVRSGAPADDIIAAHRAIVDPLLEAKARTREQTRQRVRRHRERVTVTGNVTEKPNQIKGNVTEAAACNVTVTVTEKPKQINGHVTVTNSDILTLETTTKKKRIYPENFATFYSAFPLHKEKEAAFRAWTKALKRGIDPEHMIAAAHKYASERKAAGYEYTKHPATWLNKGCYDDETPSDPYGGFR